MRYLFLFMILSFLCFSCGDKTLVANKIQKPKDKKDLNYIPYYTKIYKADSLYIVGNYERSYELLDSLFKIYKPLNQGMINELEKYLILSYRQEKEVNGIIKDLVSKWGYTWETFKNNPTLNEILTYSKIKEEEIDAWNQIRLSHIDLELIKELKDMMRVDQYYRVNAEKRDSMMYYDSINNVKMKHILLTKGYPNSRLLGNYGEFDNTSISELSTFFNHMSYAGDYEFYKDKLLEYVKDGSCHPSVWAMLITRHQEVVAKEPMKYMYLYRGLILKMFEEKEYDKIREYNKSNKEIGLPSLEYQRFKF